MLGLKLATDPRWVELVESNISEVLTDHAFCEQKALSNAISIIVNYPEHTEIVQQLLEIAQEELQHFKQVHEIIVKRGFSLGRERKDSYVNELIQFVRKGYNRDIVLMDRLLFSAMIEARSCERFKVLSQKINDPELAEFYRELMISEAGHYTTFIKLAKKFFPENEVDERWKAFLEFEATVIANYGKKETIHG
jgi:tRNA 2-(methylsulfanyl)-N6-isopentenyladenosine37 hydroxylase